MNRSTITEHDLHAYVDGVWPASRQVEMAEYLAANPQAAERVRSYQEQNRALNALFSPVLNEPVPKRLLDAAGKEPSRRQTQHWPWQSLAAGLVMAFVGGWSGWLIRGEVQPRPEPLVQHSYIQPLASAQPASLSRQAAIAHVVYSPDVRRPVEIGADQEEQLVEWLSKRLKAKIRPPTLGALGYELIGGRLLPGNSGPVAQFMYHDITGQRLTLYVSTENSTNQDTGFHFAQEGPVNVFYWIDGQFGYALSAGIDKGELVRVATAVYEQLEKK